MKHFLAIAMLLALSSGAEAAQLRFDWTFPARFEDGTALNPLTDLTRTEIEHGPCDAGGLASIDALLSAPVPITSLEFERGPGEFCFRARVFSVDNDPSQYTAVGMAVVPSGGPPAEPIVLALTWLPDNPPPEVWVAAPLRQLADRPVRTRRENGTITTTTIGRVLVGSTCDCSERGVYGASTETWCSVGGQPNAQTGLPFPYPPATGTGGAFTSCVLQ